MKIIKNTAWMVAGALALLLGFGYADPDKNRLLPSFSEHAMEKVSAGAPPKDSLDEAEIIRTIADFNRQLSVAYLELDADALKDVPLDDRIRKSYAEEIAFLKKDGRVLEQTVRDIKVKKMTLLADSVLSVDTVETVKVRYLNATDRKEIFAYPEASYAMNYTLADAAPGWKIAGVETMKVGRRDE